MTDEQLAVLLRDKVRALQAALQETMDLLPPEVGKEYYKDFMGISRVYYPALSPIDEVIQDINGDIKVLVGEG